MEARASWKERYRVDNVPRLIRPVWLGLSLFLGWTQYYLLNVLPHVTSRIETSGPDPRRSGTRCIYAVWHGEVMAFFTAFRRIPGLAMINHPLWYMKPIHLLLGRFGVTRLFLGSTGHGGKAAAEELGRFLRDGMSSSLINPDGPSGPYHQLKNGVLHLAVQSGLPIVPVVISAHPEFRLSGWDRKLIPLPFGRIRIRFGEPIRVTADSFEEAAELVKRGLG